MRADDSKPVNPIDIAGQDAALLSAIEVGLGSILHAFHVPLAGHILSINQIFILARSAKKLKGQAAAKSIGFEISVVSAMLKSLSPAGKKLTPMLAIAMQGFLFSLGSLAFGMNGIGLCIGALLSSFWSILQPMIVLYLFFGSNLISAGAYFIEKFGFVDSLNAGMILKIVGAILLLKGSAALGALWLALRMPESSVEKFQARLLQFRMEARNQPNPREQHAGPSPPTAISNLSLAKLALRDLLQPLFLASLLITIAFFAFAETKGAPMLLALLRPLTLGFCFFYIVRWLPARHRKYLGGFWLANRFAAPMRIALERLQRKPKDP